MQASVCLNLQTGAVMPCTFLRRWQLLLQKIILKCCWVQAGAKFIVSPFGSAEIADVCYYDKIPYLPGCMTLKEIAEATNGWGCEVVKIFPGEVLGTAFIKALKGPMPEVNVMVTGGVSIKNIKQWFDAGVTAVGMGSQLFDKTLLEQKRFDVIEKNIGQLIIAIQQ
jgi:2-dehydro-3-deoxyphosphogluconate aldolase / (4S)-4-hydroxy-2-oxoglutarate aldolase